jgi:predicted nucleotidyltransferase
MTHKRPTPGRYVQPYRYPSPDIPLPAIRRFARRIAERFHPDKIILFGSYAYGTPHNESDVDLLVVMPTRNAIAQSVRISLAFERPFSLDLIVRTPAQIGRGLQPDDCDWFLREVIEKGKVLYEAPHRPVGFQSRGGRASRKKPGKSSKTGSGRCLLPLPAGSREVPQGAAARTRPRRAANPRSRRSS